MGLGGAGWDKNFSVGICDGAPSTAHSSYRCIRYLVFTALFLSTSMVFIDYKCIASVTEYSKSIRLLLKRIKLLYFDRLH